jgi:hypothetical protein
MLKFLAIVAMVADELPNRKPAIAPPVTRWAPNGTLNTSFSLCTGLW